MTLDSEIRIVFNFRGYLKLCYKCLGCNNFGVFFLITGQQQHFRPFFDTRFTGHLMELRRKSDPFSLSNPQGKQHFLRTLLIISQIRFQVFENGVKKDDLNSSL